MGGDGVADESEKMIGREAQWDQMTDRMQGLCRHEGGVVLLMGEAGIGKSLMLDKAEQFADAIGLR